jgi:hypothetical protein
VHFPGWYGKQHIPDNVQFEFNIHFTTTSNLHLYDIGAIHLLQDVGEMSSIIVNVL